MNTLPSKRYDLYIKAFGKFVTEMQKSVERARTMERPYNAVKAALERVNLSNDISLDFGAGHLFVRITALPSDRLEMFERLAAEIEAELVAAGLREAGEMPEPRIGGSWYDVTWDWSRPIDIWMRVSMPEDGIADLEWEKEVRRGAEEVHYRGRRRALVVKETVF